MSPQQGPDARSVGSDDSPVESVAKEKLNEALAESNARVAEAGATPEQSPEAPIDPEVEKLDRADREREARKAEQQESPLAKAQALYDYVSKKVGKINGLSPDIPFEHFSFGYGAGEDDSFRPDIMVQGAPEDLLTGQGLALSKAFLNMDTQLSLTVGIIQSADKPTYKITAIDGVGEAAREYTFEISAGSESAVNKKVGDILSAYADYGNDVTSVPIFTESDLYTQLGKKGKIKGEEQASAEEQGPAENKQGETKQEQGLNLGADPAIQEYVRSLQFLKDIENESTPEAKAIEAAAKELESHIKGREATVSAILGTKIGFKSMFAVPLRMAKELLWDRKIRGADKQIAYAEEKKANAIKAFEEQKGSITRGAIEERLTKSLLNTYEGQDFTIGENETDPKIGLLAKVAVPYEYRNERIPTYGKLTKELVEEYPDGNYVTCEEDTITVRRVNADRTGIEELVFQQQPDQYGRVAVVMDGKPIGFISNHLVAQATEKFISQEENIFKKKPTQDKQQSGRMVVKVLDTGAPQLQQQPATGQQPALEFDPLETVKHTAVRTQGATHQETI